MIKYNEEIVAVDRRKLKISRFIEKKNSEEKRRFLFLNLLPHPKSLPRIQKLRLRGKIKDLVPSETENLEERAAKSHPHNT
jgi:hypothetical protein